VFGSENLFLALVLVIVTQFEYFSLFAKVLFKDVLIKDVMIVRKKILQIRQVRKSLGILIPPKSHDVYDFFKVSYNMH
jgi:hypothetical protein